MKLKDSIKKIVTSCVIFTMIFSATIVIAPKKSSAFLLPGVPGVIPEVPPVPVSDKAIRAKEVGFTVFGQTIIGFNLDMIINIAAKAMLERITDDIVGWINGAGAPKFVTNPEEFFLGVLDRTAGEYIDVGLGLGALCSPFQIKITGALKTYIQGGKYRTGDRSRIQCTFSGITNNIQAFIDGDFGQGGWSGWFSLTQTNNNPYNAYLNAKEELSIQLQGAQSVELLRLDWAHGFLEKDVCVKKAADGRCLQTETLTPGKVIEQQLEKALSTDISKFELADEFDEIVSALLSRLFDEIFNGGGLLSFSSGRKLYGGGTGAGGTLGGACYPDKAQALVNVDEVTWTVGVTSGANQTVTYSWNGDDFPTSPPPNTQSVKIIYPTVGIGKSAMVTVSDGTQSKTIQCNQTVDVSKYAPLQVSCKPLGYYNPNGSATIPVVINGQIIRYTPGFVGPVNYPFIWQATVTGGSGKLFELKWRGDSGSSKDQTFQITQTNPTAVIDYLLRTYQAGGASTGQKTNAVESVIDVDPTVRPVKDTQCSDYIQIIAP